MRYNSLNRRGKIIYSLISLFFFLLTVGIIWYLNHIIPFMMDDDWYSTLLYSDEKIQNFSDIIKAQIWHYQNWGGRSVTHTILQLILLAGENFADILNTLMVIIAGTLIEQITESLTKVKKNFFERLLHITIIMGMLLGLNANWEMSMFWQAGAANYLYITNFILLFAWIYLREIPYDCLEIRESSPKLIFLIIPLGIIVGWSNENMGPSIFILTIALMVYLKKCDRQIKAWMVWGSVFELIGSCLCILAPGNFVRTAQVTDTQKGTLWQAYLRGYYESTAALDYLFLTVILCVMIYMVWRSTTSEALGIDVILILAVAFLSWGAMVLSPHYPDRATYGTMVMIILAMSIMVVRILEKKPALRNTVYLGSFLIWLRGMYFLGEFCGSMWGWL